MHTEEIMTAEEVDEREMPVRNTVLQVFLVVVPWLVFWVVDSFYSRVLVSLFGDTSVPLAPFYILLVVGVIVAWKHDFPAWSYTWIGTLYFFVYRELFEIVIMLAPEIVPDNPDLIINGFYLVVNPLALALLLALITRRDWLLACFTAYPYTSIIQAWYTLDKTPFHILLVSLVLYGCFAFLFLAAKSRRLKFVGLLAGTLVVGVGFYLYRWDLLVGGLKGFLHIAGRLVLIIVFPLAIHGIPLYQRLFRCGQLKSTVSTDEDTKII